MDFAAVHEVLHSLGYVAKCAKNYYGDHTSDDPRDIMYAGTQPWVPSLLDVGRDDYYEHGRSDCLDLANDPILEPRPFAFGSTQTRIYEFFNATLDRYFRTGDNAEAQSLRLNASSGELDTGFGFNAWKSEAAPAGAVQVCRFYGSVSPGPNSHFFTADARECQELRNLQATTPSNMPRWNFEGTAFAVKLPTAGVCPADAPNPVYRVYNRGNIRGIASNHRYTTSQGVYQGMLGKAWLGEGVVMCTPS
jgi:hypothetical protein